MSNYEVYRATDGHKKAYLVFSNNKLDVENVKAAKKFFKCSVRFLAKDDVWVNGEDMYFSNPKKKGFHKCIALYYVSRRAK